MTALQRVQTQIMHGHGIDWRIQDNQVFIKNVWTQYGKTYASWDLCPKTIQGMKTWLNY